MATRPAAVSTSRNDTASGKRLEISVGQKQIIICFLGMLLLAGVVFTPLNTASPPLTAYGPSVSTKPVRPADTAVHPSPSWPPASPVSFTRSTANGSDGCAAWRPRAALIKNGNGQRHDDAAWLMMSVGAESAVSEPPVRVSDVWRVAARRLGLFHDDGGAVRCRDILWRRFRFSDDVDRPHPSATPPSGSPPSYRVHADVWDRNKVGKASTAAAKLESPSRGKDSPPRKESPPRWGKTCSTSRRGTQVATFPGIPTGVRTDEAQQRDVGGELLITSLEYLGGPCGLRGGVAENDVTEAFSLGDVAATAPQIAARHWKQSSKKAGTSTRDIPPITQSQQGMCLYYATNFCVARGGLFFFEPPAGHGGRRQRSANDVTLQLCNELRSKLKLRVSLVADRATYVINSSGNNDSGGGRVDVVASRFAHVVPCWQFYGYHLFQCLASVFVAQQSILLTAGDDGELEVGDVSQPTTSSPAKSPDVDDNHTTFLSFCANARAPSRPPPKKGEKGRATTPPPFDVYVFNHAYSLPAASRAHYSHAMYLGSETSWWNTSSASRQASARRLGLSTDIRSAPFWPMWSVVASHPSRVEEVFKYPYRSPDAPQRWQWAASPSSLPASGGGAPDVQHVHGESGGEVGRCYRRGILGAPNHNFISHHGRRLHAAAMHREFRRRWESMSLSEAQRLSMDLPWPLPPLPDLTVLATTAYRVLVVQRSAKSGRVQGVRDLSNAVEVAQRFSVFEWAPPSRNASGVAVPGERRGLKGNDDGAPNVEHDDEEVRRCTGSVLGRRRQLRGKSGSDGGGGRFFTDVRRVDWATVPVEIQWRIAATAHVIVAPHGAGNVWIWAMPPGAVFIEIWPDCVARNVYAVMAAQYRVRYIPVCLRRVAKKTVADDAAEKFSFLHENVDFPPSRLDALLPKLATFLFLSSSLAH